MKIATFALCGPGEAGRWLEQTLQQFHWVDAICVCLNNVGPEERRIVEKYADFLIEDGRIWGENQWRIKQDFLARVVEKIAPDWIICHDMDEIFDPRFNRAMAEKLASGHDVAWYFWCLQYWNTPERVRMDLSFPNIRFFKVMPELGMDFLAQALHCGLAPKYAYRFGSQSGLWFGHYGLMSAADRARKVARYAQYDPGAVYKGKSWYDGLKNERAASLPVEEAIRRIPEFIFRNKPVKATSMAKDQQVFVFINKHGKAVEAVGEKQRQEFRNRGMQERGEIQVNPHPEAPVVGGDKEPEEKKDETTNVDPGTGSGASAGAAPKRKRTRKAA
jgi:hypothetical protein